MQTLYDWSHGALIVAWGGYVVSFVLFVWAKMGKPTMRSARMERWAHVSVIGALVAHIVYFGLRWIASTFIPVSNFFEFIVFLSMMCAVAFLIVYRIAPSGWLGLCVTPVIVILMAYALAFPTEATPRIPSLHSVWLYIHVTTAAAGEAFFAIGFAAALMLLIHVIGTAPRPRKRDVWAIETVLVCVLIVVGFIASTFAFRLSGYEARFVSEQSTVVYAMPPIAAPYGYDVARMDAFLGMTQPLTTTPSWMKGVQAGRKWNTVLWSVSTGLILYGLLRLLARRPLVRALGPRLQGIDVAQIDDMSYRSIAIGFPIFTLGALIFAMIWAQIAWNRFWGWDPKEVWALITWLFYSAYLHVRLRKKYEGVSSAWLAVIGFVIVMFTLVGVNLVIAGLHSYAGV
ncbi:MAG: cytochrome c biogenesis protein CcsA [Paenibacillaceae bacterium]|nr:cytochrome c biogenesis protein CcsA [Paenibacillaceae bacterium]